MATLRELLAAAERPLVIVGGGGWSAEACADMQRLRRGQRPAGLRLVPLPGPVRQPPSQLRRRSSASASIRSSASALKDCDLHHRRRRRASARRRPAATRCSTCRCPKQKLVHVHAGAEELGRVYQADPADQQRHGGLRRGRQGDEAGRRQALEGASAAAAHADYLDNIKPGPLPGAVNMGEVIAWLHKRLPDDAIVTNGAGNYAAFLHRFFQYRGFSTQLAPTSGAMGYGVPAAVAAKIAASRPHGRVAGGRRLLPDERPGVRHRRAVRRQHRDHRRRQRHVRHDPHAPGARVSDARASAPSSRTPTSRPTPAPSAATARRSRRPPTSPPAFERALAAGKPAIIHVKTDPEALTSRITLTQAARAVAGEAEALRRRGSRGRLRSPASPL